MVTHLVVETDKGEIIYCRTSTDNEAYMAAVKRIHREMGNRVIAVVRPKLVRRTLHRLGSCRHINGMMKL